MKTVAICVLSVALGGTWLWVWTRPECHHAENTALTDSVINVTPIDRQAFEPFMETVDEPTHDIVESPDVVAEETAPPAPQPQCVRIGDRLLKVDARTRWYVKGWKGMPWSDEILLRHLTTRDIPEHDIERILEELYPFRKRFWEYFTGPAQDPDVIDKLHEAYLVEMRRLIYGYPKNEDMKSEYYLEPVWTVPDGITLVAREDIK